jgi:hypothetical protein
MKIRHRIKSGALAEATYVQKSGKMAEGLSEKRDVGEMTSHIGSPISRDTQ